MRILALTDIHGAYEIAGKIIRREAADVVIIGGDLTTVGSVKEAEEALELFRKTAPAVYCVAGNMDLPEHDVLFARMNISLNGQGVRIGDVGFFGVSGAPLSKMHTPHEFTEEEIAETIGRGYAAIAQTPQKVFVPHAPPFGTKVDVVRAGAHVGSTAVRDFIETCHPDVVICGHIHEARGQDRLGSTVVVNCGSAAQGYYAIVEPGAKVTIENRRLGSA